MIADPEVNARTIHNNTVLQTDYTVLLINM